MTEELMSFDKAWELANKACPRCGSVRMERGVIGTGKGWGILLRFCSKYTYEDEFVFKTGRYKSWKNKAIWLKTMVFQRLKRLFG